MTTIDYDDPNWRIVNNNIALNAIENTRAAPPVEPVEPTAPAAPIGVRDEVDTTPVDLAQVSIEARNLVLDTRAEEARTAAAAFDVADYLDTTASPAVRELRAAFGDYDNAAAIGNFNNYLNMFTRYGSGLDGAAAEDTAEQTLRGIENEVYRYLGISVAGLTDREIRESMGNAIDRWFQGEGVFSPQMLGYGSVDGFRLSPLGPGAEQALRYRDVLATYDRERIAAYLREMALLRPSDFIVYDPTGLGAASLAERRGFLTEMDGLLRDAGTTVRAADLQYRFLDDGNPDFDFIDRQLADEHERLAELVARQTDAYGQMLNAYQRMGLSIISASLG